MSIVLDQKPLPVKVLSVAEGPQVATIEITLYDKPQILHVNLWDVVGYERRADGYSRPRFLPLS